MLLLLLPKYGGIKITENVDLFQRIQTICRVPLFQIPSLYA